VSPSETAEVGVVGSQIASLTSDPSFAHNLGCIYPNCQCEAILDIYISRPFQWYIKHLKARCFDLLKRLFNFWESWRTPSSHFWEWEFHTPTQPKVGLRHRWSDPGIAPWWMMSHSSMFLAICTWISEMRWRISFLTSKVDEIRTGMTKILFRSTRCCCTFVDHRRVQSFNTGSRLVVP